MTDQQSTVTIRFSFGAIIAAVLSFTTHHSLFWMIVHALFGWFYVIYWALGGGR